MPYVVVAYDTPSDERRNLLLRRSRGALFHVQKSVFEGNLRDREVRQLRRALASIVDRRADNVRLLTLCPTCAHRAESLAGSGPPSLGRVTVIGGATW